MIQLPETRMTNTRIEAVTPLDEPIPDCSLSEAAQIIAELFNVFFDDWSVDNLDFELYCVLPPVI